MSDDQNLILIAVVIGVLGGSLIAAIAIVASRYFGWRSRRRRALKRELEHVAPDGIHARIIRQAINDLDQQ